MPKKIRGVGFRYSLGSVWKFALMWFVTVVLIPPVMIVAMVWGGLVGDATRGELWFFLATRMPFLVVAAAGLGLFTTTRLAGPFVALKRAFKDVKAGDMSRRPSLRRDDMHLRDVVILFNEMMTVVEERAGKKASQSE